jgi:hypothetical protein
MALLSCLGAIAGVCGGAWSATPPHYAVVDRIPAAGGAWDYAIVDEESQRLYLAQAGVTALDLKTGTATPALVQGKATHGVAALGDGTIAVDDSAAEEITVFDGASGKIQSRISTAGYHPVKGFHTLDALVLEPGTRRLIAIDGESGVALIIDVARSRVSASIPLGGHPEFAVADGSGKLYVNVNQEKLTELVTVNVDSQSVVRRSTLEGCEEATGLAYDRDDQLLLSVCGNGVLKAVDASTGHVVATVRVGRGADAVMFDAKRRTALVAGGEDGTLSVVAVRNRKDINLVQTLPTQAGTRLGAVDVQTGRVYLPSARFGPPRPPLPYPTVTPGSFEFLVVAPR